MESQQFTKFLQIICDEVMINPRNRIIDKELVLEQFGAQMKKPQEPETKNGSGYDSQLIGSGVK